MKKPGRGPVFKYTKCLDMHRSVKAEVLHLLKGGLKEDKNLKVVSFGALGNGFIVCKGIITFL